MQKLPVVVEWEDCPQAVLPTSVLIDNFLLSHSKRNQPSHASVTLLGQALTNEQMASFVRQSDILRSVFKPILHFGLTLDCL